jgi:transposase InsO family protein
MVRFDGPRMTSWPDAAMTPAVYLAAILHLYPRTVVGWLMSRTLGAPLVTRALVEQSWGITGRGRGW